MTAYPLITLWSYVQTDDDHAARVLRNRAIREGATARDVAVALRERDARMGPVHVVGGGR